MAGRRGRKSKRSPEEAARRRREKVQATFADHADAVVGLLTRAVDGGDVGSLGVPGESAIPYNPFTGRLTEGGNLSLLLLDMIGRGRRDPRYLTFRQVKDLGVEASVRKGEKGVTLLRPYSVVAPADPDAGEAREDEEGLPDPFAGLDDEGRPAPGRKMIFYRPYTVFNAEQIEGMPERDPAESAQLAMPGTLAELEGELDRFLAAVDAPETAAEDIDPARRVADKAWSAFQAASQRMGADGDRRSSFASAVFGVLFAARYAHLGVPPVSGHDLLVDPDTERTPRSVLAASATAARVYSLMERFREGEALEVSWIEQPDADGTAPEAVFGP